MNKKGCDLVTRPSNVQSGKILVFSGYIEGKQCRFSSRGDAKSVKTAIERKVTYSDNQQVKQAAYKVNFLLYKVT